MGETQLPKVCGVVGWGESWGGLGDDEGGHGEQSAGQRGREG